MKLKCLLIGLGLPGCDVAQSVAMRFADEEAAPDEAVEVLNIGPEFASNGDGSPDAQLLTGMEYGVWGRNYKILADLEREMRNQVQHSVQRILTQHGPLLPGAQHGPSTVSIFVLVPMADPVGSAAMLPLLNAVYHAFAHGGMMSTPYQVHVIALMPGLLPTDDHKRPVAEARAYAAFQELEYLLKSDQGKSKADFVWVLTDMNAAHRAIPSYFDLVPVISRFVMLRARGAIMADQSFGVALQQEADGRRTRYLSFGMARLLLERKRLLSLATARTYGKIAESVSTFHPAQADASAVFASTANFVREQQLDRLDVLMRTSASGEEIWEPLTLPRPRKANSDAYRRDFLPTFDKALHDYREEVSNMQRAVSDRYGVLEKGNRQAILDKVGSILDDRNRDGAGLYAHAWLSALAGLPSEYIDGDTDNFPETLRTIDDRIRDFFDAQFEAVFFGDEEKDPIKEYLLGNQIRYAGLRRTIEKLKADFSTKETLYAHNRARIEGIDQRLAELPSPSSDPDPLVESDLVAQGDQVAALSRVELAGRQERQGLEQEKGKLQTAQQELGSAMLDLEQIISLAETRVDRLDRAINDPSERRRLLDEIEYTYSNESAAKREEYTQTVVQHSAAHGEVDRLEKEHTRWLTSRSVVAIGAGAVLALLLVWAINYGQSLAEAVIWQEWWIWPAFWATIGGYALVVLSILGAVYLFKISSRVKAAKREKVRLEHVLEHSQHMMLTNANAMASKRLEHHVFSSLVRWREDTTRFVRTLREDLLKLQAVVRGLRSVGQKEEVVDPLEELFTIKVAPSQGLEALLDSREEDEHIAVEDFWRSHSMSEFFTRLRKENDGSSFRAAIDQLSGAFWVELNEKTLPDIIDEVYPTASERQAFFHDAFAAAAPLALHAAAVESDPLFIAAADERMRLEDALSHHKPIRVDPVSDTEAAFVRLSLGLAAFQLDAVVPCRYAYEELDKERRKQLYVNADFIPLLETLEPSTHVLGHADDPARKAACLALAYGIATRNNQDDSSEEIAIGEKRYPDYRSFIEDLRTMNGMAMRERIYGAIRDGAADGRDDFTKLTSYLNENARKLDSVDVLIIEQELSIYNLA